MIESRPLNIPGYSSPILQNEELAPYTTLRLGGPADYYTRPSGVGQLQILLDWCRGEKMPWVILGGGANVLIADRGIRGLVIHTSGLKDITREGSDAVCEAGCTVTDLCDWALQEQLSGLEWIYRMPGSVGGAVWMNARCYGSEISQCLNWVEVITSEGEYLRRDFIKEEWDYKLSPFQVSGDFIVRVSLRLKPGDPKTMEPAMKKVADDRINKGHFRKPSAGSTFKNNRNFGAPTGKIIDHCGLRGLAVGGAAVSDWHANILINKNQCSSRDFLELVNQVQEEVEKQTGFHLDPEVLCLGDWGLE